MALKTVVLLVAAGIAANMWVKNRRTGAGVRRGMGASATPLLPPPPTGNNPVSAGGDSPNAAENLQASHVGGADAGIGASLPDGGQNANLFPAAATAGANDASGRQDAITPGLPDFARGA